MSAKISLRVSTYLWLKEERLRDLLALLAEYRHTIGEVALFTGFTHPPLPLTVIEERAEELRRILPLFRALGLSAGINHLATVGHHSENLAGSLSEPWQRMMGLGGETCAGSFCPADPDFRRYVTASYVALACAEPDFIWIDDDVRLEGHGAVRYACFCDRCLGRFEEESGVRYTRETLAAAFRSGSGNEQLALRKQWLEHNRRLQTELLRLIRAAVDSVNPSIVLGMMTGDRFYDGNPFAEYVEALGGVAGLEVKWRPGAGFYSDSSPLGLLEKAHSIGRQCALLPAAVRDIQSEIECFPYQRLRKATHTTATEVAAYIAAGCTGAALNVMGISPDPFEEYLPIFEKVRAFGPFYERLVAAFGRTPCLGIWPALNRDHFAGCNLGGEWPSFDASQINAACELCEIGLPIAYSGEGASLALLAGDTCRALAREELLRLLSGGLLLDVPALAALNDMGLSEYTGFAPAGEKEVDTLEVFSDDALNGSFVGWLRDCRPSFWPETARVLRPLRAGCRVLSELTDFGNNRLGPASGVFENSLGGRVAVFGYYPWRFIQTLAKTRQLKAVCRWLSRDRLPAYGDSYAKVALWVRSDAEGRPALFLLNASLDRLERVTVHVCGAQKAMSLSRTNGVVEAVPVRGGEGPYSAFEVANLGPFEAALLAAEQ